MDHFYDEFVRVKKNSFDSNHQHGKILFNWQHETRPNICKKNCLISRIELKTLMAFQYAVFSRNLIGFEIEHKLIR